MSKYSAFKGPQQQLHCVWLHHQRAPFSVLPRVPPTLSPPLLWANECEKETFFIFAGLSLFFDDQPIIRTTLWEPVLQIDGYQNTRTFDPFRAFTIGKRNDQLSGFSAFEIGEIYFWEGLVEGFPFQSISTKSIIALWHLNEFFLGYSNFFFNCNLISLSNLIELFLGYSNFWRFLIHSHNFYFAYYKRIYFSKAFSYISIRSFLRKVWSFHLPDPFFKSWIPFYLIMIMIMK